MTKILLLAVLIALIGTVAFEMLCSYFGTAKVFMTAVLIVFIVGVFVIPAMQLRDDWKKRS